MGWFLPTLKSLRRSSTGSRRPSKRSRSPVVDELETRRLPSHAIQAVVSLEASPASNMISGPDGNLWVAASGSAGAAAIDRIGLDGSVSSFPVPVNAPDSILINSICLINTLTTGPDGNVWFVGDMTPAAGGSRAVIGNVTPAGLVTEFPPIPVPAGHQAQASSIVSGPGGDLLFAYNVMHQSQSLISQSFIARATTAGAVTLFPVPSFSSKPPGYVNSVAVGADGNLWFTEQVGKNLVLGRMSSNGVADQVPLASLRWGTVANGPGGTMIVTAQNARQQNEVFQVSTTGSVSRYKIPAAISSTFYDYLGPAGGSLWFTDEYSVVYGPIKIGRISTSGKAMSFNVSSDFRGHVRAVGSTALGADGNMYVLDSFAPNPESFDGATVYRLSPSKIAPAR